MMELMHRPGDPVADVLFNWLPLLGAAACCAFGIYFLALGFRTYVKAARLRKWGVKGRAVVTEKWVETRRANRRDRNRTTPIRLHYLRYERRDAGRVHSEKQVAPIALWDEVEPGDEVEVIHLPRGALMRLAGWSHRIGHAGGAFQMTVGGVMTALGGGMLIQGALAAWSGPELRVIGPDWISERAEVLDVGAPADPYLRVFAPGKRYVRVVFGDTQGGAWMANQRMVLVAPGQAEGLTLERGAILRAWMNPRDEYDAVLELERDLAAR